MSDNINEVYPQEIETNPVIIYRNPEIRNGNWFIGDKDTGIQAIIIPQVGQNGNWYVNGIDTGVSINFGMIPSISQDGFWQFGDYKTNYRAQLNFDPLVFVGDGTQQNPISLYKNLVHTVYVDEIVDSVSEASEQSTAIALTDGRIAFKLADTWEVQPFAESIVICGLILARIRKIDDIPELTILFDPDKPEQYFNTVLMPDMRQFIKSSEQENLPSLFGSYLAIPEQYFKALEYGGFWNPIDPIEIEEGKFYIITETLDDFYKGKFIMRFNDLYVSFDSPLTASLVVSDDNRFSTIETDVREIQTQLRVKEVR